MLTRIFLICFLLLSLVIGCAEAEYWPIVFGAKGLDISSPSINISADSNYYYSMLDKYFVGSVLYQTERMGPLCKFPGAYSWYSLPMGGHYRGLIGYDLLTWPRFVVVSTYEAATHGRAFAYHMSHGWLELKPKYAGATTPSLLARHVSFSRYFDYQRSAATSLNTLYLAASSRPMKWFYTNSEGVFDEALPTLSDTGGTPASLSGSPTVYFTNGSRLVTASATAALTTEAHKGRWLRVNATGQWYEVDTAKSNTILYLRDTYDGTTTATTAVTVAPEIDYTAIHCLVWKNRLWLYGSYGGSDSVPNRLRCSAAVSSATPAGMETFTGSDTGFVDVPGGSSYTENFGSGIVDLGDYLIAFKQNNYVVYAYNYSLMPPIEQIKRVEYGCAFPKTIQKHKDKVIYYTGKEVRITNGFADENISHDISEYLLHETGNLQNPGDYSFYDYFSFAAPTVINYAPTSYVNNDKYYLFLTNAVGKRVELVYDLVSGGWIGMDADSDVGEPAIISGEEYYLRAVSSEVLQRRDASVTTRNLAFLTGEVQSNNIAFGELKHKKQISWIEFVLRVPPNSVTTMEFTAWVDGKEIFTVPKTMTITETETNYINQKPIRFAVNATGMNFRWRLRDVYCNRTGPFAILGGNIKYSVLSDD